MRNVLLIMALLICLGAGVFFVRPALFPASLTTLFRQAAEGDDLEIRPTTLSFQVDATGMLRATSVQNFGAPPEFGGYWQFQLVSMIPEGKNVKKGDLLVSFDAQKIKDDLQKFQNELDQAAKELERTRVQIDLERQELTSRLAAAENKYEKSKLKQDGSGLEILSARQVELDRLAMEQARREVEALRERIEWHTKSSEATYRIIASKKTRAENKVNEIKRGIENFNVLSDRNGVVVYKLKWNGERYQVGESCWSGLPVIEIPDLNTILVEAFVPEVDIERIRIGQPADVTIDAFPGRAYAGKVTSIGTLVRSKAWDIPNKILEVRIALERLDTAIMRPAMSIKAKIETGTISSALAVPLRAVRMTAEGAMVRIKSGSGWQDRRVVLGDSNGSDVVILEGLKAGDRIAADYTKAKQKA